MTEPVRLGGALACPKSQQYRGIAKNCAIGSAGNGPQLNTAHICWLSVGWHEPYQALVRQPARASDVYSTSMSLSSSIWIVCGPPHSYSPVPLPSRRSSLRGQLKFKPWWSPFAGDVLLAVPIAGSDGLNRRCRSRLQCSSAARCCAACGTAHPHATVVWVWSGRAPTVRATGVA